MYVLMHVAVIYIHKINSLIYEIRMFNANGNDKSIK